MIRGCEYIETSARSFDQGRVRGEENSRRKVEGAVTKVTKLPERGRMCKEPCGGWKQPHIFQKKGYVGHRPAGITYEMVINEMVRRLDHPVVG
jgi:hypothetical protein